MVMVHFDHVVASMCFFVCRSSPILITLFEPCIREPVAKKEPTGDAAGDGEEPLEEVTQSALSLPGGSGDEFEGDEEERVGAVRGTGVGRRGGGVQYRAVHRSADA
jgi:hypothetical protein